MGQAISDLLTARLDELAGTDDERSSLIDQMGEAGGVSRDIMVQIIDGEIDCPFSNFNDPLDRYDRLASELEMDVQLLLDAAKENGCSNVSEEEENQRHRRTDRGKPLTELLKGSIQYTLHTINRSFWNQFRGESGPNGEEIWDLYIEDTFADYMVVNSYRLNPDEFYYITYEVDGENYTFAEVGNWEIVELTYQLKARPVQESRERDGQEPFTETFIASIQLVEGQKKNKDGPWKIRGHGSTLGIINGNRRRYAEYAGARAVKEAQERLSDGLSKGRLVLSGEVDHPGDKGNKVALLSETVFRWEKIELDGPNIMIEGILMPTSKGKDLHIMMESGLKPDLSQRSLGIAILTQDDDGEPVEEVIDYMILGFDAVTEHSDPNSGVRYNESKQSSHSDKGGRTMDEKKKEEARKVVAEWIEEHIAGLTQYPEKVRQNIQDRVLEEKPDDIKVARKLVKDWTDQYDEMIKQQRDDEAKLRAELGLSESDDLPTILAEREKERLKLQADQQRRDVETHIDKEAAGIKYPDVIKTGFIEAVKADKPATLEEAKESMAKHRKHFDKMASELKLKMKGFEIDVLGPVIETEFGYPEYALASFEMVQKLDESGTGKLRDFRRAQTINEKWTRKYLKRFDSLYKRQLLAEAAAYRQLIAEAETTGDLNIPYSVSRAVMAEAGPRLVAVSVYDFDTIDTSPTLLYFEEYSGDPAGEFQTTSSDNVTSDEDAWVDLDHGRIVPGTVTVGAYTEGSDFLIDYAAGRIWTISAANGGTIGDAQAITVAYTYDAIREGENSEIQRGKLTLSSKTIQAAADRLATLITDESMKFSASQIGWDAVTRNLQVLVREIQERIDQGVFYMALAGALMVANNSGGTWETTDPVSELVEKIGVAKVKIRNRHYEPTSVVLSATNADLLSNWEGFTAAGERPDADIDAAGFVGRVKGLPLFETTNFSDAHGLVQNRQLVMHRVYSAMELKGPYEMRGDNGKLVAAEEYFGQEYNVTEVPIPGKGSHVAIT